MVNQSVDFPHRDTKNQLLEQILRVASRLERLPADSIWQRKASGVRGTLLKLIKILNEEEISKSDIVQITKMITLGYEFLNAAANERWRR